MTFQLFFFIFSSDEQKKRVFSFFIQLVQFMSNWVIWGQITCEFGRKQLDVVMRPPAFVWNSYLTLNHVTFDLEVKSQKKSLM